MKAGAENSTPASYRQLPVRPSARLSSAEGGTRTRTGLRPLRPERSASTSSTTSARAEKLARRERRINPRDAGGANSPLRDILRVDPPEVLAYPLLRNGDVTPESSPSAERKVSVARNPKATHDYHILETWEAGVVLTGTEVKSLRNGQASIKEAYARLRNGEVFLDGMNITPYEQGNRYNHDPVRTRKLLLHRREIEKLIGAVEQKGLTLVPLELYFKNGRAKVVIALGRGKKLHDKREDLKRRAVERETARAVSVRGRR
jgi:SsrA-binding protein